MLGWNTISRFQPLIEETDDLCTNVMVIGMLIDALWDYILMGFLLLLKYILMENCVCENRIELNMFQKYLQ